MGAVQPGFDLRRKVFSEAGAIFGVALIVRVVLTLTQYNLHAVPGLLAEYGCVASSVASGHGFASPFCDGTGPTAWEAPVYTLLVAGIFKLFGIFSFKSSVATALSNAPFSAVLAVLIYKIGKRVFGPSVGRWSAWLFAILPLFTALILHTGWSTFSLWDTWLSAMLLGFLLWETLEIGETDRLRDWAILGFLWGLMALTDPPLLVVLPFSVCWLVFRLGWQGREKAIARALLVFAIGPILLVTPWLVRNDLVFGRSVGIRDGFGSVLYTGNAPGGNGTAQLGTYPYLDPAEERDYRRLGEPGYSADRYAKAVAYIRSDPEHFLRLSLKRVFYFWSSATTLADPGRAYKLKIIFLLGSSLAAWAALCLAFIRKVQGAFLFGALMVCYPAVYYFTYTFPRYREVIDPELLLLIVFGAAQIVRAFAKLRRRERSLQPAHSPSR